MADVFCLLKDGQFLPPAVQATVLAKYSRSPLSAREIVRSLSEEDASKFQEKWVVGYGHNSVAELATVPVCFEGISIIASKIIESWQRPGYSEKSTRYQKFSSESFVIPPGAPEGMKACANGLYETYDALQEQMVTRCAILFGKDPNSPEVRGSAAVKARAFDSLRYLLPAGTGTNVAVVANMRDYRDMISKCRGHSNLEIRALGDQLHAAVMETCPALVKHTDPDDFRLPVRGLGSMPDAFKSGSWGVSLHRPHLMAHPFLEQKAFESFVADVHELSWEDFCQHMDRRPQHSGVPNVFKSVKISFDVLMDYGAFRDLQRHRRCEQYVEPLTTGYGYVVPDDMVGTTMEPVYRKAMETASKFVDECQLQDPDALQYPIPLGFLHRSVFQMDLGELYYVVELRTKPQGHISYRRVAYAMYEIAKARWPELMKWCRAIRPDEIGAHN